jgi:CheY-like chemotaxis protein
LQTSLSDMSDRCCVLVVDDDPDLRHMVRTLLELEGCEVVTAADGREALQQARAHRPSVIVLDLMMPVMNGWSFRQEQLRDAALAHIPVLVTTAATEVIARPDSLGAARFFRKPLDFEAFTSAVLATCEGELGAAPFDGHDDD